MAYEVKQQARIKQQSTRDAERERERERERDFSSCQEQLVQLEEVSVDGTTNSITSHQGSPVTVITQVEEWEEAEIPHTGRNELVSCTAVSASFQPT